MFTIPGNIQRFSLPLPAKGGVFLTTATPAIAGEYLGLSTNPEIVTPQKLWQIRHLKY